MCMYTKQLQIEHQAEISNASAIKRTMYSDKNETSLYLANVYSRPESFILLSNFPKHNKPLGHYIYTENLVT